MTQDPNLSNASASTDGAEIKREAKNLGDTAREVGKDAYGRISEGAAEQSEQVKDGAASEMENISSALRSAADKSRAGSPQERTFGQAAEALADFSDMVRNKDLGEMLSDVNGFARRNPLAFLGGAALLGFAATRFAKASSTPDRDTPRSTMPRSTMNDPTAPRPASGMPVSPAINTGRDSAGNPSDTITTASKEHV